MVGWVLDPGLADGAEGGFDVGAVGFPEWADNAHAVLVRFEMKCETFDAGAAGQVEKEGFGEIVCGVAEGKGIVFSILHDLCKNFVAERAPVGFGAAAGGSVGVGREMAQVAGNVEFGAEIFYELHFCGGFGAQAVVYVDGGDCDFVLGGEGGERTQEGYGVGAAGDGCENFGVGGGL